ncbi:hypothetical protein FA13DRAFT_1774504 [Coprinellus micaceus]|uniref:CHAT domain-containing protein n=1 Tax=Coprinellus micaceus TaxID=71717 RepID=A0A4Y7TAV5_COPMI|nr:hypothetical protein FA13DRAFT_1774504 [Coprinellus micaceus]
MAEPQPMPNPPDDESQIGHEREVDHESRTDDKSDLDNENESGIEDERDLDDEKEIDESEIGIAFDPDGALWERWNTLYDRFNQVGDLNDISKAISILRVVVERTTEGDVNLAGMLSNLGSSYLGRFDYTGNLSDLTEAMSLQTQVLDLTPEEDEDHPSRLMNLGNSFLRRFNRTGDLEDVAKSISLQTRAVGLTPEGHVDLPGILASLGNSHLRQFGRTGNLTDVAESISLQTRAVGLTPEGHADLPGILASLGNSHLRQFGRTGNLTDVAESISLQTRAVGLTPEGHADLPGILASLGNSHLRQFGRTGNLTDVAESISLQTRAVGLTPEGHADLPSMLMNLGGSYLRQFERTGNLEDIAKSISLRTRAVGLTPEGHADLPGRLMNLGNSYFRQFKRTGDLVDVSESISLRARAVSLTPEGHADLPSMLMNLGNSYLRRFEWTGDLEDVAKSISLKSSAVRLTPEGHADLPEILMNLGGSYLRYSERTGHLGDVSESISLRTRALHLTPQGHADRPRRLMDLGGSYLCRIDIPANPHQGIRIPPGRFFGTSASGKLTSRRVQKRDTHNVLVIVLQEHLGTLEDNAGPDCDGLSEARSWLEWARCDTGPLFFERPTPAHCTADVGEPGFVMPGGRLRSQFVVKLVRDSLSCSTGSLYTYDTMPVGLFALTMAAMSSFSLQVCSLESIVNHPEPSLNERQNGCSPEPDETMHQDAQAFSWIHSGFIYQEYYMGLFNDMDLNQWCIVMSAIIDNPETHHIHKRASLFSFASPTFVSARTNGEKRFANLLMLAVSLIPKGHAVLPTMLMNLGSSFLSRFERTDSLLDINEAISVQSRAVDLTPAGHADRRKRLTNLGNSFISRFKLTRDPSDLSKAISTHTQSVEITPDSHAGLPIVLNNLANSLLCRFEHFDEVGDVTKAIMVWTRTVDLVPGGHPSLPGYHTNLGSAYLQRFTPTGNTNDVTQAIYHFHKAACLTPEMHADLPNTLNGLGLAWEEYYMSSGHQDHLNEAIVTFTCASTCTSGDPNVRLRGAIQWARLCARYDPEPLEILTAFETVMNLLMLVAGLEETVRNRYAIIEEHGGLPVNAAAIAITFEAPQIALEWLEQGRCLVWGQQSRLRKVTLEDEALKHSQLASELDSLLEKVRVIPGFESFLRPLQCAAILEHLPLSGYVVVLNVCNLRCDAVVLRAGSDELQHVPLTSFTLQKAKRYRHMLSVQLRCHGLRAQDVDIMGRAGGPYLNKNRDDLTVHSILRSLWKEVVKPILNALGLSKGDSDTIHLLPRIWWCPTGPMSFLPLHAAGVYQGEGAESISNYVVSSYTPTVTALTQRVKNDLPINDQVSGLFLTCQPEAPHAAAILGTIAEVREIHKEATALGMKPLILEGDDVAPDECLDHMERYSSIHLACHGVQDISDPLRSRFLFHKGPLPLSAIMQKNLPNADLAYLSACQTSTGQETLADEVVHLAAGMLAAGYRRVVSTMWEIGDGNASQVAREFYQYLWKHRPEGSGSRFDGSLSAYALHHATQELRGRLDNTDRSLLAWMPFVHYGY